ncbi:MAG TPA: 3-phosphoshikimate 1-carboxyvinyltransferase [Micromonosporaceae bacterium]|jgi:3-phosphoshikimate 1-carboxyvinyltransferase|nr:3-phosphoshikimate 1-carboxyvinyltransferase [Micromonosporaceae bacterium]
MSGSPGVPDKDRRSHSRNGQPAAQPWAAPRANDPVRATISLPGSKSITARALVLAGVSIGSSTLRHPLSARDTILMANGLRALGTHISAIDDDLWVIRPRPLRGPAHVDVGLAGTVMRFLPPVAALADGSVAFDGDPRARQRPLAPLIQALRQIGVEIDDGGRGGLPLTVRGNGRVRGGQATIDASASSQLISGLLLAAHDFDKGIVVRHEGLPVPSTPHITMTVSMLRAVGAAVDDSAPDTWVVEPGRITGRAWSIEPDLSNAAPFLAAALVTGGTVTVADWPARTAQPGDALKLLLTAMGGRCAMTPQGLTVTGAGTIRGIDADLSAVSELVPALAALAVLADSPSQLRGIGHMRGHETDRLAALSRELIKLGAKVSELPDGLAITPQPLRGAVFETYDDHRLATAAAIIGLAVDGVVLSDVACTSKTLPAFRSLWSRMLSGSMAPDSESES